MFIEILVFSLNNSGILFSLLWFTRLKPYLLCNIYLYTCICLTCLHPSLRPHSFSFMCFISFFWNNFWTQNLVLGKRTNVGVVCICCAKIINCIENKWLHIHTLSNSIFKTIKTQLSAKKRNQAKHLTSWKLFFRSY